MCEWKDMCGFKVKVFAELWFFTTDNAPFISFAHPVAKLDVLLIHVSQLAFYNP